jgi:hypothetical protein
MKEVVRTKPSLPFDPKNGHSYLLARAAEWMDWADAGRGRKADK